MTYTYGVGLTDGIPTHAKPAGKTFVGWKITEASGNWVKGNDYTGCDTTMYGDITIEAQYKSNSGELSFDATQDTTLALETKTSTKANVLILAVKADYEEDYDLPLYVTATKEETGKEDVVLVQGTDYTYDRETGEVTVKEDILKTANVVVKAEADDVRDIYVEVEASNILFSSGAGWAQKKKDFKLEFEAAENATLPAYVTVELVTGKDESREVAFTYSAKKGTITIEKETLAALYEDESLVQKNFGKQKYYLLITINAATEGKVNLTCYNRNTKLTDYTKTGISFEAALTQIEAARTAAGTKANRAVIELLGDCTTTKQIVVEDDFTLEIVTAEDKDEPEHNGPFTLTSTYTNKKHNYAIELNEDSELELDIAGLYYKADAAVYDADEEDDDKADVTASFYPSAMTITGAEMEGTYLLAKDGYSFAEALGLAKAAAKTCDDAVVLDVLDGKYTETGAVTLPEDVTVVLGEKASVTLSKKALALNGQTVEVAGALNLKGVSGTGSLILTAAKAAITSDTQLVDLVSTNVPDMFVSEETAGGSYIYTVSDVEPEEIEETEDAEADGAEAEQAGEEFGDLATGEITITCGAGGTAAPASFTLTEGETQVVSITLDAGYSVSSITVNGVVTGTDKLIATSTGYVLNWDTAEDSSIAITFVATPTFSDVTADAWFYSNVMFTTSKGLMVGFPGGTFEPYDTMTVAQYLTVMYRYLQDQAPAHVAIKSTTGSSWTEGAYYVNTAFLGSAYQNIETTKLTRYAVADITYRVLKALESYTGKTYSNSEALSFTDVPATDSYYTAVTYLSTVNIIDGYVTGGIRTYAGANTITRAEIAKVLNRLMLVG